MELRDIIVFDWIATLYENILDAIRDGIEDSIASKILGGLGICLVWAITIILIIGYIYWFFVDWKIPTNIAIAFIIITAVIQFFVFVAEKNS